MYNGIINRNIFPTTLQNKLYRDFSTLDRYNELPDFLQELCGKFDKDDKRSIREAYRIAIEAHAGQQRKSWDPYILHVEAVLSILWKHVPTWGKALSPQDIIVALLHDVVEDHPQYFGEILETFGYDLLYRILCLSKPSREIFHQWQWAIPIEEEEDISSNLVYQLWQIGTGITPPTNNTQIFYIQGIVVGRYQEYFNGNSSLSSALSKLMHSTRTAYSEECTWDQQNWRLSEEDRRNLGVKRWQEFLASMQLLLISPENFTIKLADKIHNLSDLKYRECPGVWDQVYRAKMERKTKSILRTVPLYRFLCWVHDQNSLLPVFQQAVTQSEAYNTLTASGAPSVAVT